MSKQRSSAVVAYAAYFAILLAFALLVGDIPGEGDFWDFTIDRLITEGVGLGDPTSFAAAALDIYNTGWISEANAWIFNLWPPGFPLFEALLLRVFGRGASIIIILQVAAVVLHSLVALTLFSFARTKVNAYAAFLLGLCLFALPMSRAFLLQPTGASLGETFAVGLFLLGFLASIAAVRRFSFGACMLAGVLLALSAYFRSQFEIIMVVMLLVTLLLILLQRIGVIAWVFSATVSSTTRLAVLLIVASTQVTMLPWRVYHYVNHNSLQWVFTSTVTAQNAVSPDDELTARGGGFVVRGGGNLVCRLEPTNCGNVGDAQHLFYSTFANHPIEWITIKLGLLGEYWFAPVGSWTSVAAPPTLGDFFFNIITAVAIALSIGLVLFSSRLKKDNRWFALLVFNATLVTAYGAIFVFAHYEARYFYFPKVAGIIILLAELIIFLEPVRGAAPGSAPRSPLLRLTAWLGSTTLNVRGHPAIAESVIVDSSASISPEVAIAAFTLIGPNVTIGPKTSIGAHGEIGGPPRWSQSADSRVSIAHDVEIGSHVTITGSVTIETGVKIGNGVTLHGPLSIGERSEIFDNAVIGAVGQFPGRHLNTGRVEIGADVVVREFVSINQPVTSESTSIGNRTYLMARSQVDHDCQIGADVKLASGVTLGGSVRIDDFAYLGMNCVVHQGRHIGAHAMIGMNGSILKHVPPYAVVVERQFTKINVTGLERRGFSPKAIEAIATWYANVPSEGPLAHGDDLPELTVIDSFYRTIRDEPRLTPRLK